MKFTEKPGMDEQKRLIGEMAYRLESYLAGERAAARWHTWLSLPGVLLGVVILTVADRAFWLGLGWTSLLTAAVLAWTGQQYFREWRQLAPQLPGLLRQNPQDFIRRETARMQSLLPYHHRMRTAAVGMLLFGIVLTLAGGVFASRPFTLGMGVGGCAQGAVLLVLTVAGHWRNDLYSFEVEYFGKTIRGTPN